MPIALPFGLTLSPLLGGALLIVPVLLLVIANRLLHNQAALSSRVALAQKLGWGIKETQKKVVQAITKLPDPSPVQNFDLKTARTRDHIYVNKTLRYPYNQTMAHQPMHIDNWIEIDYNYERDLRQKKEVIDEHGSKVLTSLPENDAAAGELLETLIDYLPKRYPTLFEKIPGGIWNKVTDERFPEADSLVGTPALMVISRLVQDDFLMGREREDGHVYFVGGVVAHPGFYDFSQKINKSLEEVHLHVPQFNEKILKSVERTLKRFEAHQPFERSSWEMVDDYNLYHHNIADLHEGGHLPDDLHPKDYYFRIDHQTFRKMPKSRGMIFGVHPILRRLEEFADLPLVPQLLATIHEQSSEDLMKYKLAPVYQDKMLPYLRELTQSQIDRGLIKGDEEVADFRDLVK
ncbi:hypothetical protein BCR35DRAFT_298965 [Leucosporidium creatinivorum]|uniref:Uncharacterized protein n=1 Tax=Leucosporidium creatinivorum TaxID=106004 RepID=A0A1Y2G6R6_9BASI|nr:hypothetical protein BCR35DRAFT_298965 [Leucosporidium creatinivorum]